MIEIKDRLPGLGVTALLALAALQCSKIAWLQVNGIGALTLAIVSGMGVGNTLYPRVATHADCGVTYARQTLLRLGIILYGLRLTFQDIANVGISGVLIDSIVLSSTFLVSWWAGTRLFGLERTTAMLIGAGSSICGAAAIMAAEPVVAARPAEVTVAISTVVVFGTLAIFVYPAAYHLNQQYQWIIVSPAAYGVFAGSTIHEVAQVVAAGRAVGDVAGNTAVITKMVRVMMLAPFLVVLSAYMARRGTNAVRARIVIPWFALGFVAVAGLNSLIALPRTVVDTALTLDTLILAMAMAALGLTTRWSALRSCGIKPLLLAALLFGWLLVGGGAINAAVTAVAHLARS